ncbi:hypothetical protein ACI2IX_00995 [Leifsonia aquatica]|uniref:hypothetical protein n=1 Tax=Leifsonia aquatica TaxID=144185 RepID=UPI00384AB34D
MTEPTTQPDDQSQAPGGEAAAPAAPATSEAPTTYAPPPSPYPPAPGTKTGIRPWMWWVIGGVVAVVAVVIVAVMLFVSLLSGSKGPKDVAEEYLNDIARGDAKGANALARADSSDFLLTNAVLAKAKRITDPAVTGIISSRGSRHAQVEVTYTLAGKTHRDIVELDKDVKGWFVSRGFDYTIPYVSSSIAGFTVAGADRTITHKDFDISVYPGVYTLGAPNRFYDLAGSPTLTIAAGSYDRLELDLTPSAEYLSAVQKQVDAHYEKCATETDFSDLMYCGIDLDSPDNMSAFRSTVAVTIVESPKAKIDDGTSYREFTIGEGAFTAVVTGADYDGKPAKETVSGRAKYISANISIKNGKVVVTFR